MSGLAKDTDTAGDRGTVVWSLGSQSIVEKVMTEIHKSPRGRKRRLRSVTVVAIDPSKYPQFRHDPDNPYSSQSDDVRVVEVGDVCAQLLAQASLESKLTILSKDAVAA